MPTANIHSELFHRNLKQLLWLKTIFPKRARFKPLVLAKMHGKVLFSGNLNLKFRDFWQ